MRCREYPDYESAVAGCGDGEEVARVTFSPEGGVRFDVVRPGEQGVDNLSGVAVQWGVIPAFVEIDQGEGRDPVRQPGDAFLNEWWSGVVVLSREERECTEV